MVHSFLPSSLFIAVFSVHFTIIRYDDNEMRGERSLRFKTPFDRKMIITKNLKLSTSGRMEIKDKRALEINIDNY